MAEALWLEAHRVDAIIAQGLEAGGHRGNFLTEDLGIQIGTFALVPQILQAVKTPVIASGGIVNRTMRELGPMNAAAPVFRLAASEFAPLRAQVANQGRGDFSPLWAGQNATGCKENSAALRTRELASALPDAN